MQNTDFPALSTVATDNDEDSLVDLIFQACKFDCIDILEWESIKKFGHDELLKLDPFQERYIVETCRGKVARRAFRAGYRPPDTDRVQ
ncbi:hypothetical protein [Roseibium alexandrii]|uniref:Uncharacterized protein n=1 Tax=Roseibium alexandrii (strain DSM 17067 / NCIMB 14079 / DFL-11) TaxID=244592 RepID=A0A5E8GWG9_ROSAD|nr:hypothetical protein [Roseibium alexandrii]EEE43757.2 hypothetical protein SADFL11_1043 [Roseibium alexandrii DFL-11]